MQYIIQIRFSATWLYIPNFCVISIVKSFESVLHCTKKNYDASIMMSLTHYYNQILSNTYQCSNPAWLTDTLQVLPIRHCMPILPKEVNISLQPSVRYAQTVFKRSQRSLTRLFSKNCQGWFKDFTARLRKLDMQSTHSHLGIASAKTLEFLKSGWCDLVGVEIFGPSDNQM